LNTRVTIGAATPAKLGGWLTTPLSDMAAVASKDLTVTRQRDGSTVRAVVPGNSLLTFVLQESSATKKSE
jgi:hypothetical protein